MALVSPTKETAEPYLPSPLCFPANQIAEAQQQGEQVEPRPARAEAEGVRKRFLQVRSLRNRGLCLLLQTVVPLGQRRHIHMVKLNRRTRHRHEVAQYAVAYPSVVAQNQIPTTNCTSLGGFRSLVNTTQAFEDAFHVPAPIRPLRCVILSTRVLKHKQLLQCVVCC